MAYYAKPLTVTDDRIREAMEKQAKQKALRESLDSQMQEQRKVLLSQERGGGGVMEQQAPIGVSASQSFSGTIGMSKGAMRRMRMEAERQEMAQQGGSNQRPPLYSQASPVYPAQQANPYGMMQNPGSFGSNPNPSFNGTSLPQLYPTRVSQSGSFNQGFQQPPPFEQPPQRQSFEGTFGPQSQFNGTFTQQPSPMLQLGVQGQVSSAGGAYAGHIPPPPPQSAMQPNVRSSVAHDHNSLMKFVNLATDNPRAQAPQSQPGARMESRGEGKKSKKQPIPAPGQQEWFEFSDEEDEPYVPKRQPMPHQYERPKAPVAKAQRTSSKSDAQRQQAPLVIPGTSGVREPTPAGRQDRKQRDNHRKEVQANSKVNKLEHDLVTQATQVEKMKEKERVWEMQVSKLKSELKQARQKEKDLNRIVQRAETAPQEGSLKRGGANLPAKKVRQLQPLAGKQKQQELNNTVKFGEGKPFRPITAPIGPEELQQSEDEEDTPAPPLVQRTVIGFGGQSPLEPQPAQPLQYASASPVQQECPLDVDQLVQLSKSHVITLKQAEQLWELFAGSRISLIPTPPVGSNAPTALNGAGAGGRFSRTAPMNHHTSNSGVDNSSFGMVPTIPSQQEEDQQRLQQSPSEPHYEDDFEHIRTYETVSELVFDDPEEEDYEDDEESEEEEPKVEVKSQGGGNVPSVSSKLPTQDFEPDHQYESVYSLMNSRR